MKQSSRGNDTRIKLRNWSDGQPAAEGLAAQILRAEGYESVDPSHPLGGRDGLKDIVCTHQNHQWIGAAFFPNRQPSFSTIQRKFRDDLQGVTTNRVDGIVFVTNQELSVREREKLTVVAGNVKVEIFHLERIVSILNSPVCYGIRLEYLGIEMSKEEQLSYISSRDALFTKLQLELESRIDSIIKHIQDQEMSKTTLPEELSRIKNVLAPVFEDPQKRSFNSIINASLFGRQDPTIGQIKDFIEQLERFEKLLPPINEKLGIFLSDMRKITRSRDSFMSAFTSQILGEPVNLQDAQKELTAYEQKLDRVIAKQKTFLETANIIKESNQQNTP